MSNTRTLDYGWFFLRLSVGIHFLQIGIGRFHGNRIDWFALAALICGIALIIGIFVRPAVFVLLALMVGVFVSGSRFEIRLVRESLTELLALTGFLIGGGGSFLALGAAVGGLRGKWYQ